MTEREALKLALEWFEKDGEPDHHPVVTAIKEALAQPEHEPVMILPDGSAFGVMSFPLPSDHWLYAPNKYRDGEDEPIDLPKPILTHVMRDAVVAAVRYAVRGATMRGQENDFDPDALVQNAVYALCGPYGKALEQQPADEPVALREALNRFLADKGVYLSRESIDDFMQRLNTRPQPADELLRLRDLLGKANALARIRANEIESLKAKLKEKNNG